MIYYILCGCLGLVLGIGIGIVLTVKWYRRRQQLWLDLETRIRATAKELGKRIRIRPTDTVEKLTDKLDKLNGELAQRTIETVQETSELINEEPVPVEPIEGMLTISPEGTAGDGCFGDPDGSDDFREGDGPEQEAEEGVDDGEEEQG